MHESKLTACLVHQFLQRFLPKLKRIYHKTHIVYTNQDFNSPSDVKYDKGFDNRIRKATHILGMLVVVSFNGFKKQQVEGVEIVEMFEVVFSCGKSLRNSLLSTSTFMLFFFLARYEL